MMKIDGRKLSHAVREEIRIRAVKQVETGESPEVVVRALGFHRSCIYEWIANYQSGGEAALRTKRIPGRPPKLTGAQLGKIYQAVKDKDPLQLKFAFALWTCALVREWIRREFGVRLSEVSVGRLLKKLGLSPQKPLRRAYQQDAERVKQWKEKDYPAIRRRAKKEKAVIYFGDESSLRSDSHSGTTWAPVGKTPIVKSTGARFSLNLISAVSAQGLLRFRIVEGRMNADKFIDFLKRLLADETRPVFLIVDNHPVHCSKPVRDFVEGSEGKLRLFFLPPYSPELNPDELVWNHLKNHRLGRSTIKGPEDLKNKAMSWLRSLQKLPRKILGFFRHPDVSYITA
jgi:transposase